MTAESGTSPNTEGFVSAFRFHFSVLSSTVCREMIWRN
jgi:hypothetical protein